ncbi:MAG TPA: MTH938/NDUFAF3 family protein [Steroidobacteraceae bacterium]|nr:MTH938/NDUFAF3 family protein [Steroidobacteraceae bacterium]
MSTMKADIIPASTTPMKFTREQPANVNLIRSYSSGELRIGEQVLRASCLLSGKQLIVDWTPRTASELTLDHFAAAWSWQPEIILLGAGTRPELPTRELYAAILSRGIGFEVMDIGAACRTFNVLVSENRRVAAGLLLNP